MTFPILSNKSNATPIHLVSAKSYKGWLAKQPAHTKKWLSQNKFNAEAGTFCLLPDKSGSVSAALCGSAEKPDMWALAHLPALLPAGAYKLADKHNAVLATQMALGWALACYEFTRYKKPVRSFAQLVAPQGCDLPYVKSMAEAICWGRDLVNTPANDMTPAALAAEASRWAKAAGGTVTIIKGKELLKQNYPLIYAVGKASETPPHLIDMRFGKKNAPKITLVGKGVCFDSGGLDIKSSSGMLLMKKDMGGAAAVLSLAKMLVEGRLPINLRVLLPAVENAIAGNAMRPSDVIKSRKGLTVEIGNTDAEGRLVLCDALAEADSEKPDLIIDCATLTGAARVALGTDLPAFFTPNDSLARDIEKHSKNNDDLLWRLPLHAPYLSMMESGIADINNAGSGGYAGAITAALYLQKFVTNTESWVHIDMMAWNLVDRPGRPRGGEAMAVRTLYELIKAHYGK